MQLPEEFKQKIIQMLGEEEFAQYESTLSEERAYGLRPNELKIDKETLRAKLAPIITMKEDVAWSHNGMYFDTTSGRMPGRLPYYLAGLYYIQEPSAMYPAEVLEAKPGDRVLDLCAAPGGKSTEIAACLQGQGILVSNDISAPRANTLLYNLELSGISNAMVTNESPAQLAKYFPHWFDKILIDAPCSGEGMFRKDEEAVKSWGNFKNETCVAMQQEILAYADALLKPGGRIVYSTCTFDIRENEGMMQAFLEAHPDYTLLTPKKPGGIADGFGLTQTARLWPHKLKGEGHFTAVLEKGTGETYEGKMTKPSKSYKRLKEAPQELRAFYKENLTIPMPENLYYYTIGEQLFSCPFEPLSIDGLKVLRMGIHVGTLAYGKLKPAQSFIMSLPKDAFVRNVDLSWDSDEVKRYVRGESLNIDGKDGLTAVRVEGYILGVGDLRGDVLKNAYPKGWRRML
ncbi:MAG: RsmF rRNA methyltransferase first C-terminal domain-containing protein [Clostridia bacterium]|nr:RsmF rRNA methyltransferase first C-terminal domain-containing protein [Clostridia bacterium]